MQWATWVGVQAELEIPWFLCKERRKTKPFSLSNSKLYVQPGINIFFWCQGQSLWRKDHYFNSMSAGEEKGLLENKPNQRAFPVPQEHLSLYNKQLIDSFSWNAWIDSMSKADFSSRVTISWKQLPLSLIFYIYCTLQRPASPIGSASHQLLISALYILVVEPGYISPQIATRFTIGL